MKFSYLGLTMAIMATGICSAHAQSKSTTSAFDTPAACSSLHDLALPGVTISQAVWIKGDTSLPTLVKTPTAMPAHCLVDGVINARRGVPAPIFSNGTQGATSSNGLYGIHFELRMPAQWAGRFFYQGGGGLDGVAKEAVGVEPSLGHNASYLPALYRGFAVVTSDGGHDNAQNPGFGMDPQARLNYAYASIGSVTNISREILKRFYGHEPRWSYFIGCSKGGQEALQAMQHYGSLFNGIVAGDPGYRLPQAAVAEAWDSQAFAAASPLGANGLPELYRSFSQADLELVSRAVIRQCTGGDGTHDDMDFSPSQCHFKPQTLQCKGAKTSQCLSEQQVLALTKVFGGARDANGKILYSDWPYDTGIASPGWRLWKLGTAKMPALNVLLGGGSLKYVFTTPPDEKINILTTPVGKIADATMATDGIYKTSAIAFMDANSTSLHDFLANKGRLIIYHGISDPVFSVNDTIAYYQRLEAKYGKATPGFARLFLVPGMNHCGGGDYAPDSFDTLDAIINWVEHNQAPSRLIAKASDPQTSKLPPGLSRPLCPYPQTPHYNGHGNQMNASSFICR